MSKLVFYALALALLLVYYIHETSAGGHHHEGHGHDFCRNETTGEKLACEAVGTSDCPLGCICVRHGDKVDGAGRCERRKPRRCHRHRHHHHRHHHHDREHHDRDHHDRDHHHGHHHDRDDDKKK